MADNLVRTALVQNDEVINVVMAPAGWTAPDGKETLDAPVGAGIEIGMLRQPDGTFVSADNRTLEETKENALRSIDNESRKALRTLTALGATFQTDDRSVLRILTAVNRAKGDATFTKTWITADNKQVLLSNADLIALGDAVSQHEEDIVFAARRAKDDVLAATDKASIDAVDWRTYL